MATVTVGVQEFQSHLNDYIESDAPVAITQDGRRVGLFIPAPRKRTEADRQALKEASDAVQAMLDAAGITEDQIYADIDEIMREEKLLRKSRA